jgi:hypothetical protein
MGSETSRVRPSQTECAAEARPWCSGEKAGQRWTPGRISTAWVATNHGERVAASCEFRISNFEWAGGRTLASWAAGARAPSRNLQPMPKLFFARLTAVDSLGAHVPCHRTEPGFESSAVVGVRNGPQHRNYEPVPHRQRRSRGGTSSPPPAWPRSARSRPAASPLPPAATQSRSP